LEEQEVQDQLDKEVVQEQIQFFQQSHQQVEEVEVQIILLDYQEVLVEVVEEIQDKQVEQETHHRQVLRKVMLEEQVLVDQILLVEEEVELLELEQMLLQLQQEMVEMDQQIVLQDHQYLIQVVVEQVKQVQAVQERVELEEEVRVVLYQQMEVQVQ
jgi:hypothetical protein